MPVLLRRVMPIVFQQRPVAHKKTAAMRAAAFAKFVLSLR